MLGGASSEILGGSNLADVLRDGFEAETRMFEALQNDAPAEALSCHTSAGVPASLDQFLTALAPHLPVRDRAGTDRSAREPTARADIPLVNRDAAAAATRIVRGDESRRGRGRDADSPRRRIATPPRPRRG